LSPSLRLNVIFPSGLDTCCDACPSKAKSINQVMMSQTRLLWIVFIVIVGKALVIDYSVANASRVVAIWSCR